ncbi:MAG: tRNA (N6-isopentenyl adenosine(37)-C2)-methylthiotransferase MiaB [Planctomycetota bacterium]
MPKRLFIQTVGCQMNVLDSELVVADLAAAGYELVDSPRRADTILFNTCSVRQHAEDKIYSALGRLKHAKEHRPETVIGILGCMAQKDREGIFRRAPHVDLVVGPGQLRQLPELIEAARAARQPHVQVSLPRRGTDATRLRESFSHHNPFRSARARATPHQALVRIMYGCDNFCTYCIVPHVRGPEQSRPAAEIVEEVRRLADEGCLEVTLLGQTVNSYHDESEHPTVRLHDLLARLNEVPGLRRIRFLTSQPRYMTRELLEAVRDLGKVSPYLHVPAQSGSTAVLRRMHRGYTAEYYREMLAEIRQIVPGAAVTSDFIVGFCGETEDEFEQTVALVRDARFKNSFIFKYSARPGTVAAERYADDVPDAVKRRRNNELLDVQNAISLEDNLPLVGQQVEILVEGPSKVAKRRQRASAEEPAAWPGGAVQLTGRTRTDRIVVFDGPPELTGQILNVEIDRADAFTLHARPVPAVG